MKHSQLKVTCHHKIQSSPIACSNDAYDFFMKIWDKKLMPIQEQNYLLYLNARNEVIEWKCITTGTSKETLVDIKLSLGIALSVQAFGLIPAHNHPSGILRPTRADLLITSRLKEACNLLDIRLDDNLIVSDRGFYSFADHGLV